MASTGRLKLCSLAAETASKRRQLIWERRAELEAKVGAISQELSGSLLKMMRADPVLLYLVLALLVLSYTCCHWWDLVALGFLFSICYWFTHKLLDMKVELIRIIYLSDADDKLSHEAKAAARDFEKNCSGIRMRQDSDVLVIDDISYNQALLDSLADAGRLSPPLDYVVDSMTSNTNQFLLVILFLSVVVMLARAFLSFSLIYPLQH